VGAEELAAPSQPATGKKRRFAGSQGQRLDWPALLLVTAAVAVGLFAAYNLFHYILFFLVTHPKDAGKIGQSLNAFEQLQLVEWTPRADDFLKHDDENRTYDDVFGTYRHEQANYSTCVFSARRIH
jgi:hypothetical protein